MVIRLIYNEGCRILATQIEKLREIDSCLEIEMLNEDNHKEKKKALQGKISCGAKLVPFVAIYNDSSELIKAFYSEVGECTVDNINKYLECQRY